MKAGAYQFRPMTAAALPLVLRWLKQPHVAEWWGDPREQFELASGDLEIEAMDQFIVARRRALQETAWSIHLTASLFDGA